MVWQLLDTVRVDHRLRFGIVLAAWTRSRPSPAECHRYETFSRAYWDLSACIIGAWACVGGWIYYNAEILNDYQSAKQIQDFQKDYEVDFKQYQELPQPRVIRVKHEIDLYPAQRKLVCRGDQTIVNQSEGPIEKILVKIDDDFENTIEIENASVAEDYTDQGLLIYQIDPPLQPGQSANMKYTISYAATGFENSLSQTQIVQNGSFFNNTIAPQIGYLPGRELSDRDDREDEGLSERDSMPPLKPDDEVARRNTYLSSSSDWLEIESIFSTSDDQIAIAPGTLVDKWEKDGRRYFHYKLDHPSLNFYSFVSACLLYTSPSPRDQRGSRMPSSA